MMRMGVLRSVNKSGGGVRSRRKSTGGKSTVRVRKNSAVVQCQRKELQGSCTASEDDGVQWLCHMA